MSTALDMAQVVAGAAMRPRLGWWLRVAASLCLLALLLALVDLSRLDDVVAAADVRLLAAMLALSVGERLFATWRWLALLRVVEPGVRCWPVLRTTLVSGFFGIFLPGSVGTEVLRVYGLSKLLRDLPLALSSILVERLCGLLTLVAWIGIGLVIAPIGLPHAITVVAGASLLLVMAAATALLHARPRRAARRLLAALGLGAVPQRLRGFERRLDAYARRPGALLRALALAFGFQLLRITTVAVGAVALGIEVDPLLFALIVPLTILVSMLPISVVGFGPREASYVALLGMAGVAPEAALVLGLTREAMNLIVSLPGAALYAFDRRRQPSGDDRHGA